LGLIFFLKLLHNPLNFYKIFKLGVKTRAGWLILEFKFENLTFKKWYLFFLKILAEKYDEAKRLKQAISELYKIGERLARYDIEKRQAIEDEDYEKAKIKKQQMQEYRNETYKQLNQNNLLEYIDVIVFFNRPLGHSWLNKDS